MVSSPDIPQLLRSITVLDSPEALEALMRQLAAAEHGATVIAFLNQHGFNLACERIEFRDALLQSDLLLRDGVGIEWAMRRFGLRPGLNMNGTDFIPRLVNAVLRARPACSLHLYGTREPWLGAAAEALRDIPQRAVVTLDGFLPEQAYVERAAADGAPFKLIVLGMGMPRQETVARALRQSLQGPALIVCGGAILDFLGGRVARAPAWMRDHGLEWAYRLSREPRRLFRRYVVGIPLFLWRIARARNEANEANA